MSADNKNNDLSFLTNWQSNKDYFQMLNLMASLSRLFSENDTPYLDYRLAENLFCKYYNAINDARSCTAYDARIHNLGIGIKTFIINNHSTEKIAEFNKLKTKLDAVKNVELARLLAQYRNDRIKFANNQYDVNHSIYHIVGRKNNQLIIFNTPYDLINLDEIKDVKETSKSITFSDDKNFYLFNKSKSVLMKRFEVSKDHMIIPIDILKDPLSLLSTLIKEKTNQTIYYPKHNALKKGKDYVILPLYSKRGGKPHVPERSGLNQWNAKGRPRNANEIYIPIPRAIHKNYPDFFPNRDVAFNLILPNGKILSASICQEGNKALMSNPNSELGEWLLRKVLNKKEGELITFDDLLRFGVDSVLIQKIENANDPNQTDFKISFANSIYESYDEFIND